MQNIQPHPLRKSGQNAPSFRPFRRRNLLRFPETHPLPVSMLVKIESNVLLTVAAAKNRLMYGLQNEVQMYVWRNAKSFEETEILP